MSQTFKTVVTGVTCSALLLPGVAGAQARTPTPAPRRTSAVWIAPYLGLGFQSAYYDGVVQFSDGGSDFLTVDPGTSVILGAQLGYRFNPKWTLHLNVSTASPNATYVEDLTPRPDVDLRTTQFEAGLLYQVTTFRVGRETTPLAVGGGLSLTSHSVKRFTWNGNAIRPATTAAGAHALAALDIPLGPKLDFHGQAKLSVTPLSLGDLEEKLAAAQGGGVTAALDAGTSMYFQFVFGVAVRL